MQVQDGRSKCSHAEDACRGQKSKKAVDAPNSENKDLTIVLCAFILLLSRYTKEHSGDSEAVVFAPAPL